MPIENGSLRLVVVADTHSAPHPNAARLIAEEGPHAILHAGDIGHLKVLDDLAKIAPVHAVRGNIDEDVKDVPEALTLDLVEGTSSRLKLLMLHIAVNGPKLRADAHRRAQAEHADLVICGHSHVPFIGRDRDLTVFNPGSVGPRRFTLPILFGVLTVADGRVSLRHVDCETGNDWRPR
ncbi:MAG TPA: metallophosphoesterase family protein [Polyangiaceae bacterium]